MLNTMPICNNNFLEIALFIFSSLFIIALAIEKLINIEVKINGR